MRLITSTSSPVGHETLTVSSQPIKLTPAAYGGEAVTALVTVELAAIRFWLDGEDPTTTTGILLSIGDAVELDSMAEISGFTAIAVGDDATLNVAYSA